ncbi:hypothetical protein F2P81_007860 [Scophthalmus maximus]|uniref:Uncharacterized protein n=1 Tax=Scophthalmus maximus TaxID=52904 RepID=A0A6A4T3C4_SCOMX|nr:hypothetical protein F2P81_007860 [Scophthalmus maximus]
MNGGGVVMFVETVAKANQLVESGIVINGAFVFVTPLVTPATRVTVTNIPPFVGDDFLRRELSRHELQQTEWIRPVHVSSVGPYDITATATEYRSVSDVR